MRQNIKEADEILGLRFPVLDHGWVELVDYCGGDSMIESFARTSYGKGTRKTSDTRGLIRYLIAHHHSSPIESTELSFSMSMPIHVARQIVRHRSFSPINEFSGRYSIMPDVFYNEYTLNLQAQDNKQGRSHEYLNKNESDVFKTRIQNNKKDAFKIYEDMLNKGVAREISRMHLNLNLYTYWFCKMDLNNLFKFLKLRIDKHAQYEVRQYAHVMAGMVKRVAPLAFDAWYDYSFSSTSLSRLDRLFYNYLIHKFGDEDYNFKNIKELYENYNSLYHIEIGMSKRELKDFWEKLSIPEEQDFVLDIRNKT